MSTDSMANMDFIDFKHREALEKAWADFHEFTGIGRSKQNFDLFSCGYMRGRTDQLGDSVKRLQAIQNDTEKP